MAGLRCSVVLRRCVGCGYVAGWERGAGVRTMVGAWCEDSDYRDGLCGRWGEWVGVRACGTWSFPGMRSRPLLGDLGGVLPLCVLYSGLCSLCGLGPVSMFSYWVRCRYFWCVVSSAWRDGGVLCSVALTGVVDEVKVVYWGLVLAL
ncbi:hypothetical protein Tco_0686415 [Tanacetum coccineum]